MNHVQSLQEALGYFFEHQELLARALTHKSFFFENVESCSGDNEKLEFLGDAVLGLGIGELLMELFPLDSEGDLSKKRASMVNERGLMRVAQDLELGALIRLGKGEEQTGGSEKPSIVSSAFEAVIGAVFLDGGYAPCRQIVRKLFTPIAQEMSAAEGFQDDYKTRLQVFAQEHYKLTPSYRLVGESGPDHDKSFEVAVSLKDQELGRGCGRSKKLAEQQAAQRALEQVGEGADKR